MPCPLLGPPGPPEAVTIDEITDTTAQLSWRPGPDNHSPITMYVIQARTPFSVGWQAVNTGTILHAGCCYLSKTSRMKCEWNMEEAKPFKSTQLQMIHCICISQTWDSSNMMSLMFSSTLTYTNVTGPEHQHLLNDSCTMLGTFISLKSFKLFIKMQWINLCFTQNHLHSTEIHIGK
jgi:hypothetical protein